MFPSYISRLAACLCTVRAWRWARWPWPRVASSTRLRPSRAGSYTPTYRLAKTKSCTKKKIYVWRLKLYTWVHTSVSESPKFGTASSTFIKKMFRRFKRSEWFNQKLKNNPFSKMFTIEIFVWIRLRPLTNCRLRLRQVRLELAAPDAANKAGAGGSASSSETLVKMNLKY